MGRWGGGEVGWDKNSSLGTFTYPIKRQLPSPLTISTTKTTISLILFKNKAVDAGYDYDVPKRGLQAPNDLILLEF